MTPQQIANEILAGAERTKTDLRSALDISDEVFEALTNLAIPTEFPLDRVGNPLAWPDPNQPEWYVDAWNGIYSSREEALKDVPSWIAKEEDRLLNFGDTAR